MKKRRVALVLAGGGARGVAHIGAIEELERQGFEISAVAGTSMGALVGGVYASGYLEPFKEWMRALDKYKVFSLVDFALSTEGLVKGDRVMEAMKELVPDVQIERMPVPFAAVAADLLTGDEVVLDSGGLYDAIRASISIPSVFRPVHRDGPGAGRRRHGQPAAAEPRAARGGRPAGRRGRQRPVRGRFRPPGQCVAELLQGADRFVADHAAAHHAADVPSVQTRHHGRLPADSYGMFEFYRSEEILEAGRAATRAALERLETDGENGMFLLKAKKRLATARF